MSSKRVLSPSGFPIKIKFGIFISPKQTICSPHLVLLDLKDVKLPAAQRPLYSRCLCNEIREYISILGNANSIL